MSSAAIVIGALRVNLRVQASTFESPLTLCLEKQDRQGDLMQQKPTKSQNIPKELRPNFAKIHVTMTNLSVLV